MSSRFLSRALRRAMFLSLLTPALAGTTACGTAIPGGDAQCALEPLANPGWTNGGCAGDFPLVGHASDCGAPSLAPLSTSACLDLCPPNPEGMTAQSCMVEDDSSDPQGVSYLNCQYTICGTGRRPPGLAPARIGRRPDTGGPASAGGPSAIARYLGEVAHLEAASVVAFAQLADELRAHGAPERIVRATRRAGRDEERHAQATRRLALRAGARPSPIEVAPVPARDLEAIAIDNAVEGCVRETFGAVLAMRQAEQARDGELRRAMGPIAREETRHAALSWELARWLDGRLDAAARRRVRRARDRAVASLRREATREPHASLVAELGVPTSAQARAAIDDLCRSLWSPSGRAAPAPPHAHTA